MEGGKKANWDKISNRANRDYLKYWRISHHSQNRGVHVEARELEHWQPLLPRELKINFDARTVKQLQVCF